MADQQLTPDVRAVLENGYFDNEGTLFKISGKLDPDFYPKVDLILKLLGGKWNKSQGGHVFPRDSKELLAACLEAGMAPDMKKRRQAYYTPEAVVRALVEDCWLEEKHILEPSAGGGAIAVVCKELGAKVDCIELDPFECANLHALGFTVRKADFLEVEPDPIYDMVVMNPPFTKGQDERHVLHALKFVKPGGKVVAIVSPSFKLKTLRELTAQYGLNRIEFDEIEAGAFKESGTNIPTRRLTIRTFGDVSEPHNADQVEWRGHQLAVEVIHGGRGREIEIALSDKNEIAAKQEIHRNVKAMAEERYRSQNAAPMNLIVNDEFLEKIMKEAELECISYFDLEDTEVKPTHVAKETIQEIVETTHNVGAKNPEKISQALLFDFAEETLTSSPRQASGIPD